MSVKTSELRKTLGQINELATPVELEAQNLHWDMERVFRNLSQDTDGTFGIYGRAKLRSAYQPILSITHRRVVGYEALLRPYYDDGSQSSPADLLASSAARGEQLIVDRVSRAAHVANYGAARGNAWLFLNMHPDVFSVGSRTRILPKQLLQRYDLSPQQIVLELLEQQSYDETAFNEASAEYRAQGFMLAIDDFGSGQSNFDRVWNMHPDFVKLDRSLVQRAEDSLANQRMVRHIVALLHQAGTMVVAEGVETRRQALVMMEADVDFLQGFWLGHPSPAVSDAQAKLAVERLNEAWDSFAHYDETLERERAQSLKPFRAGLKTAAHVLATEGDVARAAAIFFSVPGTLRFFILDDRGVMNLPAQVNAFRTRLDNPSLRPLQPDVDSNWSRRAYFKQALKNLGKVVIVGPHYSLTDGQGVYTAAIAQEQGGNVSVLCGDFELASERTMPEVLCRAHPSDGNTHAEDFDPTLSVIGLASGMPRPFWP